METTLAVAVPVESTSNLALAAVEAAADYAREALSPRTRELYRRVWAGFEAWCARQGASALPALPVTLAAYLAARADEGRKVGTIALDAAAVSAAHRAAGYDSPCSSPIVQKTLRGIRRRLGRERPEQAQPRRVAPLLVHEVRTLLRSMPDTVGGARDRAMLALGFAAALRRSELVALEVGDVRFCEAGLEITIRHSKTDAESVGQSVAVPMSADASICPVRLVREWLAVAGLSEGPLFRHVNRHGRVLASLAGRAVARRVKRWASTLGLDAEDFSGHSLRAGYATSSVRAGRSDRDTMRTTRHKSVNVFAIYTRDRSLWDGAAAVL